MQYFPYSDILETKKNKIFPCYVLEIKLVWSELKTKSKSDPGDREDEKTARSKRYAKMQRKLT